jgi:hypothetical protein
MSEEGAQLYRLTSISRLKLPLKKVCSVRVTYHCNSFAWCLCPVGHRTVWYRLTRRERFYGDLMSPAIVNCKLLGSSRKMPDFNQTWNFLTGFHKGSQYQISRTSVQWDPRWFMRMDGWMDMTKPIGAFRDYANTPKNYQTPNFIFISLWRFVPVSLKMCIR